MKEASLKPPEDEVVTLLARGQTLSQIAETLDLSIREVAMYRASAMSVLGARSRFDIRYWASEHGLLDPA